MALNWKTYAAIPTLRDYAEAKQHHDNVVPIRGDVNKTRPVGRREQKWFSIWEKDDAIHVGYGARKPEDCMPLVSYLKSGSIIVTPHYRGASTNERMSKITGEGFQTYQYDTWVRCHYYDNGELKRGHLPLRPEGPNIFVRHGDKDLTFINYTFPKTHKVNRAKMKDKMDEFGPFLNYVKGLWKLSDDSPHFTVETQAEAFGMEMCPYRKIEAPVNPPNLRWGRDKVEVHQKRQQFFEWVASDEPMDHLRAVITLKNTMGWRQEPVEAFREYIIRTYKEGVLDVIEHRDGKLVKDRLKYFLL